MTISRERTAIVEETDRATFSLPQMIAGAQSPWLLVTEVPRPGRGGSDRLCVIVEPVEQTARASSVGAGVVAAIRDIYASSDARDPLDALNAAIDAANLALYQQNLTTTPGHRVLLGLTCLVQRGDELLICQVPPTQLILSQGGEPIALPELATWGSNYQPRVRDDRQGLGAAETATPLLFRATIEDGDLITLCTSNIAALIAHNADDLGPLLGTDPTAAITYLSEVAEERGLDSAYATALAPTVGEQMSATSEYADEEDEAFADEEDESVDASVGWLERNLREVRERSRIIPWPRFGERHQGPAFADSSRADDDDARLRAALEASAADERPISAMSFAPGPQHTLPQADDGWDDEVITTASQVYRPEARSASGYSALPPDQGEAVEHDPLDDILPSRRRRQRPNPFHILGSVVALPLLVIGTVTERLRLVGGRRSDRYMEDGRKRVWPIGSLERYQSGGLPLGRGLPLVLLIGLVLFLAILLISLRNHQARVEQGRFDAALAQVTRSRETATASSDRQVAHLQLLALPQQLQAIPAADKPGRQEQIAAEAAAIDTAIDQIGGVQRLSGNAITILGALPEGVSAASNAGRPQIVIGGGKQYVFLNGLIYMADGRGGLTKILAKGDMVGGTVVGTPLGIVWRETALFAYTETQGLSRDAAGTWTLSPLVANGRKATAVESFDGNLYLLEAERGQIIKYAAGAYNQAPQPWSSSKMNGDLTQAVDFTIDKDIYTLLSDGRILDLYQGETKGTLTPAVVPPLAGANAIAASLDGQWLYILDGREGRIARVARDGSQLVVYKAARDGKALTGAREIAVDEATNTAYLLTDDGLLSVRLP